MANPFTQAGEYFSFKSQSKVFFVHLNCLQEALLFIHIKVSSATGAIIDQLNGRNSVYESAKKCILNVEFHINESLVGNFLCGIIYSMPG